MFQALAQYQVDISMTKDMDLDVSINMRGRSKPILWRINTDNALVSRTEQVALDGGKRGRRPWLGEMPAPLRRLCGAGRGREWKSQVLVEGAQPRQGGGREGAITWCEQVDESCS